MFAMVLERHSGGRPPSRERARNRQSPAAVPNPNLANGISIEEVGPALYVVPMWMAHHQMFDGLEIGSGIAVLHNFLYYKISLESVAFNGYGSHIGYG